MKQLSNQWILFIIILVAVVLRLFNFSEIPFTHDEFSALDRLDFDSFSTLINEGVKIDAHPAGVQVFLFYWTKIFGFSEEAIKFPFIVFGVLAVYFTYLIGKRWFNETVGLLSAATVSCLQFTVMYSQIARPYISGLLFSLMMVYYLTKLIQNPKKNFFFNGILFVISGALCAYNHHFSLLFAAIVGISGIFFIPKAYLGRYALLGLSIFVLYIPHLSIFFYQLSLGGIEAWLAKPEPDFILDFISYIFNHSWIFMAVIVLIALGFLVKKKAVSIHYKHHLLFLIWFLLPIGIGYFYSTYFSAVMHFSVLIFSFTYLLFLIYGHLPNCKPKTNLILVLLVLIVGSYSLVFERQHYRYFYQSCYIKVLTDFQEINESSEGKMKTLSIVQSKDHINDYYMEKLEIDTNYHRFNSFESLKAFKSYLVENESKFDQLYLGSLHFLDPLVVPIIREFFPVIETQNNYFGGTTYLFTKTKENYKKSSQIAEFNFDSAKQENWAFNPSMLTDSIAFSGHYSYFLTQEEEWGPGFEKSLKTITDPSEQWIDVSIKVNSKSPTGAILVLSLEDKEERVFWSGFNFNEESTTINPKDSWTTFHGTLKVPKDYINDEGIQFKTYIWNKEKKDFLIDDFKISTRKGNEIVYGIINKF